MARLLDVFLATPFDGGRHAARVAKISALERQPPVRTARSADGR
jgi:ribose 5-phosphate isomerase RpiB